MAAGVCPLCAVVRPQGDRHILPPGKGNEKAFLLSSLNPGIYLWTELSVLAVHQIQNDNLLKFFVVSLHGLHFVLHHYDGQSLLPVEECSINHWQVTWATQI
jgi:hypothetical protein